MESHKLNESSYGSDTFTEADFDALSKIAATRRIPHYSGTTEYQAGFNLGYLIRGGIEALLISAARHLCKMVASLEKMQTDLQA